MNIRISCYYIALIYYTCTWTVRVVSVFELFKYSDQHQNTQEHGRLTRSSTLLLQRYPLCQCTPHFNPISQHQRQLGVDIPQGSLIHDHLHLYQILQIGKNRPKFSCPCEPYQALRRSEMELSHKRLNIRISFANIALIYYTWTVRVVSDFELISIKTLKSKVCVWQSN